MCFASQIKKTVNAEGLLRGHKIFPLSGGGETMVKFGKITDQFVNTLVEAYFPDKL